ncbi:unnamed protein product [Closterium sp. Naga37s-1]|nr:unnamed protein product [Closterium sp. Naga37s-1]
MPGQAVWLSEWVREGMRTASRREGELDGSGMRLPLTHCLSHIASHTLPLTHCLSRIASHTLPLTHCLSRIASHALPLTHCLSHIASHALPLTHCLSHIASHTLPLISRIASHALPLTHCLSRIASHTLPLTHCLSRIASHALPLTHCLSRIASHALPLTRIKFNSPLPTSFSRLSFNLPSFTPQSFNAPSLSPPSLKPQFFTTPSPLLSPLMHLTSGRLTLAIRRLRVCQRPFASLLALPPVLPAAATVAANATCAANASRSTPLRHVSSLCLVEQGRVLGQEPEQEKQVRCGAELVERQGKGRGRDRAWVRAVRPHHKA